MRLITHVVAGIILHRASPAPRIFNHVIRRQLEGPCMHVHIVNFVDKGRIYQGW